MLGKEHGEQCHGEWYHGGWYQGEGHHDEQCHGGWCQGERHHEVDRDGRRPQQMLMLYQSVFVDLLQFLMNPLIHLGKVEEFLPEHMDLQS